VSVAQMGSNVSAVQRSTVTESGRAVSCTSHWTPITYFDDARLVREPTAPRIWRSGDGNFHNSILSFCGFHGRTAKKTNEWVLNIAGDKEGTVRHRHSKEASILWSHHEETRELPGERDNARDNARCTQARKTTYGMEGQHQDVDRTPRGRVS